MPTVRDSPRAITPRTSGSRIHRWRRSGESSGNILTSISPVGISRLWLSSWVAVGLRTAIAQVRTPRIMTPSRTAWPPTGASRVVFRVSWTSPVTGRSRSIGSAGARVGTKASGGPGVATTYREAAARWRLLATRRWKRSTRPPVSAPRVERVAVRADLDLDLGLRRPGRELVAAGAADVGFCVGGVYLRVHPTTQCSDPDS